MSHENENEAIYKINNLCITLYNFKLITVCKEIIEKKNQIH